MTLPVYWFGGLPALAAEYCFGSYEVSDGRKIAVLGETWTFDHAASDSLEGWTATKIWGPPDMEVIGWSHLDDFAEDGLPPGAPIIDGVGMIWCGVHQATADSLCYACGIGYGPNWCQKMVSPEIAYTGGSVTLELDYWESALGTALHWRIDAAGCRVKNGTLGGGSWSAPEHFQITVPASSFAACSADSFRVFFTVGGTDPGDQDCSRDTFGAFGVDNVSVSGGGAASFDFESGPQGWRHEQAACNSPLGIHIGTRDLASYGAGYDEWAGCSLEGRVLKFHDKETGFSDRFSEFAYTPVIDLASQELVSIAAIRLKVEQLLDYDLPHYWPGIHRLTRIRIYPETCDVTGVEQWGPWHLTDYSDLGGYADCRIEEVDLSVDIDTGEPVFQGVPDSIQVGIEVEVCRGCMGPDTSPSNVTPFFDNISVCVDGMSAVDVAAGSSMGKRLLLKVDPNPLQPNSTIRMSLDRSVTVEIGLYDPSGRRVRSLPKSLLGPGLVVVPVQRLLEAGSRSGALAAGSFVLRVRAGDEIESARVVMPQW